MLVHTWMIVAWSVAWISTVLGSFQYDQARWWWVIGGVAMAVPASVARRVVLRSIDGR